ncbi:MAG: phosphate/phosphite/phosphonate ABC transporter substrate-binding protein [Bacillota bacterium]
MGKKIIVALIVVALAIGAYYLFRPAKPLIVGFVPSQDASKLAEIAQPLADMMKKELGRPVQVFIASNYTGLIEALGSGKADVGFLASAAYVLAHDTNGTKVILKTVRNGSGIYRGQFTVLANSNINGPEDFRGKRIAIVDPVSTSGYIFPMAYLKGLGYNIESDFTLVETGGHDNAIVAVLNGDADIACTYEDARDRVAKEYPDVKERTKVVGYTAWIPNDTVSVRPDMDDKLAGEIKAALLRIAETEEGVAVLKAIYNITGLTDAQDSEYDVIRETLELGFQLLK